MKGYEILVNKAKELGSGLTVEVLVEAACFGHANTIVCPHEYPLGLASFKKRFSG